MIDFATWLSAIKTYRARCLSVYGNVPPPASERELLVAKSEADAAGLHLDREVLAFYGIMNGASYFELAVAGLDIDEAQDPYRRQDLVQSNTVHDWRGDRTVYGNEGSLLFTYDPERRRFETYDGGPIDQFESFAQMMTPAFERVQSASASG